MMASRKRRVQGAVISDAMDKSITVEHIMYKRHRLYGKPVRSRSKYVAHDPENECRVGDEVIIEESRPLSRRKRWRMREIVQRAEISSEEEADPSDTAAV